MTNRKASIYVTLALSLLVGAGAHAQPTNLRFRHLTIDDGLSQNLVSSILQDSKGFLWFSTNDGLNRYDGYRFKIFKHDPYDSTSLADNELVYSMFEDHAGRLWVGTRSLNLFDRKTETFQRFVHDPDNPASLSSGQIRAIAEDRDGTLWLGTTEGICRLTLTPITDPASVAGMDVIRVPNGDGYELVGAEFTSFVHAPENPGSLTHNQVRKLIVDTRNRLWATGGNWLDMLDPESVKKGGEVLFRHYSFKPEEAYTDIAAVYEDRSGTIWVSGGYSMAKVIEEPGHPLRFEYYPFAFTGGTNWTNSISEDADGRLWIATGTHLSIFDLRTEQHFPVRHDPRDANGLSYNTVLSVYRDRSDNMWVGTSGKGVDIYIPRINRMHHYQGNPEVFKSASVSTRTLIETPDGHLWFVTTTGEFYKLDQSTGELTLHPRKGSFAFVRTAILDHNGDFWLATNGGVVHYSPRSQRLVRYRLFALMLLESADGAIWAAGRSAVFRFDRTTGQWQTFPFPASASLPDGDVTRFAIHQDSAGVLWLGGHAGLIGFDPVSQTVQRFLNDPQDPQSLSSNFIYSILPDPRQPHRFLWLGTKGGGLNRFDMHSQTFRHFTEKDGLPNNVVYGVLPDDQGNLWLSTNRGLCRITLSSDSLAIARDPTGLGIVAIKRFDVNDGLQSNEFNYHSYYKGPSGRLYFGGINGITSFDPEQIQESRYRPPVVITDFLLAHKRVDHRQADAPLRYAIAETKEITLSHKQNALSFEFAALDFTAPQKNQYAYKMEGLDDDWIYAGSDRRANYFSLSPGDYVFRVKATNSDGVWNEDGAAIRITILPPWWQTWWAYTLYAMLLLALLYSIRSYELNRIGLKNQLKIEQIEAEKFKDLDAMKSRFFANISHEFRTPLTLILGPIDNLLEAVKGSQAQKNLRMIRRHARHLLQLINQLLDLSKLESGKMRLQASCKDLIPVLRGVTSVFQSMAEKKKIDLQFHSELETLDLCFEQEKLEKIFYNLLSNAVKFTGAGGKVSVTVNVVPARDSYSEIPNPTSDMVEIRVKDTGIGIPKEKLPYIFYRFYRIESDSTRDFEGTGIGLALAKDLAELHHGTIEVTSQEGWGTEAIVQLPLGRAHLSDDEIVDTVAPAPSEKAPLMPIESHEADEASQEADVLEDMLEQSEGQKIVLVVEDNGDMRSYIRQYLADSYQVIEACDGREGLEQALATIPDLVISDVMMPIMDGYALCRALKTDEKTCHVPVILLTAKAAAEDKLAGLEIGADDYLTKPFDAKELSARVTNLIQLRQQLKQKFRSANLLEPGPALENKLDQAFLKRVQKIVEENLEDESFGVEELAQKLKLSRTQLHRKISALTNRPASLFIRSVRLYHARKMLEQNDVTINEVAYRVGFSSHAYFSKCFRDEFGVTPKEFVKGNTEL